jgi:hypothetical protein
MEMSGLDKAKKILDPTETKTLDSSVIQPITSHYTDCNVQAPEKYGLSWANTNQN